MSKKLNVTAHPIENATYSVGPKNERLSDEQDDYYIRLIEMAEIMLSRLDPQKDKDIIDYIKHNKH